MKSKNANSTSLVTASRAKKSVSSIILQTLAKCILKAGSATELVVGKDILDHAITINKDIVKEEKTANIFI